MSVENPVESELRACLRRAADGPAPASSLADVARRAERRRAKRRTGAAASVLLLMLVGAGALNAITDGRADRATSVAAGGGERKQALSRPVIALHDCRTTTAAESSGADVILGRATRTDKKVQVLFDPTRPPPSGQLVIVERLPGVGDPHGDGATGAALRSNATVRGQDATVAPMSPEGQSGADFELADGSFGLLTTRQLTSAQVRQVLDSLQPRPDPASGFDLGPTAPTGLELVDLPALPAEVHKTRSDCVFSDGRILFLTVITGEPAVRYAALSGVAADAIGRDTGGSTVTVSGAPGDRSAAAALAAVTDTSVDHWRSLLAAAAREGPS